jgi:hypothetical protein
MSAMNLGVILGRAEQAYEYARGGAVDGFLPLSTREHFNYDVPELIGAVKRLTDELEQERRELGRLRGQIEKAYESLLIDEFDGDSCPDLQSTIEYAIDRYRAVCKSEAEAADRIQDLRIQLKGASRG